MAVCHIDLISVLVCTLPSCEANDVPVPVATRANNRLGSLANSHESLYLRKRIHVPIWSRIHGTSYIYSCSIEKVQAPLPGDLNETT